MTISKAIGLTLGIIGFALAAFWERDDGKAIWAAAYTVAVLSW